MHILIVVNGPAEGGRWQDESLSDRGVEGAARTIGEALKERGFQVSTLVVGRDPEPALQGLRAARPDVVFQLVETIAGDSRLEPAFPFLVQWLGIPMTGNSPAVLTMVVDKGQTKHLFKGMGVRTPEFAELFAPEDLDGWTIFPALLKPAAEDASLGIDAGSIVRDAAGAKARFEHLARSFGTPVLIERFVDGREANAACLQLGDELRIGLNEIDFSDLPPELPRIVSYEAKWVEGSEWFKKTPVKTRAAFPPATDAAIRETARRLFRALRLSGYARFDFRVDAEGVPWLLEINPNPDLSVDAGFARALPEMGVTYADAVEAIVRTALRAKPRSR